jgi:DNA-binding beta-propeller fold protein YncE
MIRHAFGVASGLALLAVLSSGGAHLTTTIGASALAGRAAPAPPQATAPRLQVDPLWPKPLPNHWLFGSITGVAVDSQNHVWVVHRGADSLNPRTEMSAATNPPTAEACCHPAPPVLEFDEAGTLVGHWGGPGDGYEWPQSPGGIAVDAQGQVWITAAGVTETAGARGRGAAPAAPRPEDAHVLKFSRAGKFLLQIGRAGTPGGNDSTTGLRRPAAVDVDAAANEVYVADGIGNSRVVVFDATTGAYKRHWGAYGKPPGEADAGAYNPDGPPSPQFRTVSCVKVASDGHVYVCDRRNNRIQVFLKNGTFVKEAFVSKTTTGEGSVWDLAFSRDPQQRYLFVADAQDQKVFVLDRNRLAGVSSFGGGGRWPGGFYGVGSVAVDARGNVYTGENFEGKRLQKFVNR